MMNEMNWSASASRLRRRTFSEASGCKARPSQRLLQIVTGGIGELIQIVVRLPQRFVGLQKLLVRSATRCSSRAFSSRISSSALRSVMSRIADVTSSPSSVCSGLRLISTGNSLPSLRRRPQLPVGTDAASDSVADSIPEPAIRIFRPISSSRGTRTSLPPAN